MSEKSRPSGLELLLIGVPYGISDRALKRRIDQNLEIEYDFLVVFTESCEHLFWASFSDPNVTRTARVVIPNSEREDAKIPGEKLLKTEKIPIHYKNKKYILKVKPAQHHETTNDKYNELRSRKKVLKPAVKAVVDGVLGDIHTISCGNFDDTLSFETAHKWSPKPDKGFNKFSYYGDAFPKKFQACLTESHDDESLEWEWIDLHESNIQGIIFEGDEKQTGPYRVVYFVLDKPPQFYRRTMTGGVQAEGDRRNYVSTRLPQPSIDNEARPSKPETCDVAGISWVIQFSRVFKIEYEKRKNLTLASYKPRLSKTQRADLIALHHGAIEQSALTGSTMIDRIINNFEQISIQFRDVQCPEIQIAILKLLYNCHLCPWQPETTETIEDLCNMVVSVLEEEEAGLDDDASSGPPQMVHIRRNICDALRRGSESLGTSQFRALCRLHNSQRSYSKMPSKLMGNAPDTLKPLTNLLVHLGSQDKLKAEALRGFALEVFEILIYPSHIQIRGPVIQGVNSIIEEYWEYIDRFIRVRFVDNNEKPFKSEANVNPDTVINDRIVQVLLNHLQLLLPISQQFEFLGYSVSSLKKKKAVWLLRTGDSGLTAERIRARIGSWTVEDELVRDLAQKPSKWGARLALAFTEAYPVIKLSPNEWTKRKDEGLHEKFPNTDGCGLISMELGDIINQKLVDLGYRRSQAFQIRFGGTKGVVYCGVPSLLRRPNGSKEGLKMLLRESQVKFNTPNSGDLTLRVVSTAAEARSSLFFAPVVKVLEDSGVNTTKIEKIYNETYNDLRRMNRRGLEHLQEICKVSEGDSPIHLQARHVFLQLAIRLSKRDGILPEEYTTSFLAHYLIRLAERARAKNLFEIPIPDSCQALGLIDEYDFLGRKEVYIRARGRIVRGEVLIYRDPIIHIGDIQRATALDDEEVQKRLVKSFEDGIERRDALFNMDNVIFFSKKDDPPFPNLLSGGDLDGDRFEILTVGAEPDSWLSGFRTSPYNNYIDEDSQEERPRIKDFDIEELAKFIGQYIQNDCFYELQNIHMCLADEKAQGMEDPDVKGMARWLSQAVDYAKSGLKVDLYENVVNTANFKVRANPDFACGLKRKQFYDSNGEYYPSSKVLGRIYRSVSKLKYQISHDMDDWKLYRAIAKNNNFEAPDEVGKMGEPSDPFEQSLLNEIYQYRLYLEAQQLDRDTEMDVFLWKKLDDFPKRQLDGLDRMVIRLLLDEDVIEIASSENALLTKYVISRPHTKGHAENRWKAYLFRASTISLGLSIESKTGFGRSFAYLCLYALYFHDLPASEG